MGETMSGEPMTLKVMTLNGKGFEECYAMHILIMYVPRGTLTLLNA